MASSNYNNVMTDEKEETGKVESPGSRHDKFIRDFLSEKETAKSFFREYLPLKVLPEVNSGNR